VTAAGLSRLDTESLGLAEAKAAAACVRGLPFSVFRAHFQEEKRKRLKAHKSLGCSAQKAAPVRSRAVASEGGWTLSG